ncbi:MAG: MAPEG family protein [Acidobacteriota bacterium]
MTHFLLPAAALVLWTFVLWFVLYARRLPAMAKVHEDAQEFIRQPDLMNTLPDRARWAADNYNHLHEQPTLFYAVMLLLFVTEQTGSLNLGLGWAYFGLRVVHSLVQVSSNVVLVRFSLFATSSMLLLALAVRAFLGLLG